MITKTTTNALVYAQMDLDAAERNRCTVTISNICLVPTTVQSKDLNEWRERELAPAEEAFYAATAKRDDCLKAIGLSLEVWLIKWQSVKVAAAA